ncbi:hypothetical protein SEMRO_2006_G310560.1 [Seminavis robusta]|uniref:Uncharacterized protein n=1 Tax=Seminavis robusta TaxID=568900 RepID=A0A9N8EYS2_9STRA|nr:hypothetical protein SEMRO_2006_G310560.1 [Seminavis robusta]|eukprot:Sro2006_g310560.1 n/a (104) ;mRNA; r:7870-8181
MTIPMPFGCEEMQPSEVRVVGSNGAVRTSSEVLEDASMTVTKELESLEYLNTRQAVSEIAQLYDIPTAELWIYHMKGEEELERFFNIKHASEAQPDPTGEDAF